MFQAWCLQPHLGDLVSSFSPAFIFFLFPDSCWLSGPEHKLHIRVLTLFNGGGHSTNSWNSVRVKQTCKSEFHKCQRFLGISLLSVFLFCFLVWWAMQVLQKHLPGSLWWIYFFKDKIKCPWSFIEEFPSRNPYSHSISNKWLEGVNRNLWAILTTVLGELGGWSESGVWGSVVGIPWFLKVFWQSRNLSFSYPGSIG